VVVVNGFVIVCGDGLLSVFVMVDGLTFGVGGVMMFS
tara:strand:- start:597 stop:707 length:111 start_codon:yes stop_codon:yes gene_type:complete